MIVRIAAYENAIEAHLARMRLEHEGIPAFVIHEHHVWANWLMSNVLQGVKVYVHRNDANEAREIVRAHDRGEYALPDEAPASCPRCGGADVMRKRMSWKGALLCANLAYIPLPFRWATLKCRRCKLEWDLPDTSTVPANVIAITAAAMLLAVFAAILFASHLIWKIFW
jgi:Putative prokaryotic signal transducing protein